MRSILLAAVALTAIVTHAPDRGAANACAGTAARAR